MVKIKSLTSSEVFCVFADVVGTDRNHAEIPLPHFSTHQKIMILIF